LRYQEVEPDHQVPHIDTELLNWLNEFVGVMTAIWCWTRGAPGWFTRIDGVRADPSHAVRSLLKEVGLFGQNTFTKGCTRSSGRVAQGVGCLPVRVLRHRWLLQSGPGHGYVASANGPCWRIARPAGVPGVNSTVQEIKAPSVTTMKRTARCASLTGW